jgi:DNA-binding transcriptional MerR regulator
MPNLSNVRAASSTDIEQADAGRALQLFEPPLDAVYTIDVAAHLVDVQRRTILIYCKRGLISPTLRTVDSGYSFDRNAILALRRIKSLRAICGDDLCGIKIILDLMNELERLHSEMRSLRNGMIRAQENEMQYMRKFI